MVQVTRGNGIERGMFVREYAGQAPSRTLLWIHGLGESGLCFERIVRHPGLSRFRHLVPDLPGYGRSPWQEEPLTLEACAGHMADWLRDRDEPPLVLVGHSMGGVVGQILAEASPCALSAFVNVEGNISSGDCTGSGQAAAMNPETFLGGGFQAMQDSVYALGASDEAFRGAYASLRLCDPSAYHLNARELVEVSNREDLARRLAALPIPSWYVAGVPRGAAPRSLQLLEDARVRTVRINPSGHWPFIDQPDAFARELGAVMDQVGQ